VSDIILEPTEQVTLLCDNVNIQGHDLLLDSPSRRHPSRSTTRRALVHDENDGLTVNFSGDYPGGVTLVDVGEIIPRPGDKLTPELVVRGGISYETDVVVRGSGHGPVPIGSGESPAGPRIDRVTVSLGDELQSLQSLITALTARVAALEASLPHA
jgi:hypothetical protein